MTAILPTAQTRPLPKLPFLAALALILAVAALIAFLGMPRLGAAEILGIAACVALGTVVALTPFVLDFVRTRDAALFVQQAKFDALAAAGAATAEKLQGIAEQVARAGEVSTAALRQAEQLPPALAELHERIKAFDQQRWEAVLAENADLQQQRARGHAAELTQIDFANDRLRDTLAQLVRLEDSVRPQLAALQATLAEAPAVLGRLGEARALAEQSTIGAQETARAAESVVADARAVATGQLAAARAAIDGLVTMTRTELEGVTTRSAAELGAALATVQAAAQALSPVLAACEAATARLAEKIAEAVALPLPVPAPVPPTEPGIGSEAVTASVDQPVASVTAAMAEQVQPSESSIPAEERDAGPESVAAGAAEPTSDVTAEERMEAALPASLETDSLTASTAMTAPTAGGAAERRPDEAEESLSAGSLPMAGVEPNVAAEPAGDLAPTETAVAETDVSAIEPSPPVDETNAESAAPELLPVSAAPATAPVAEVEPPATPNAESESVVASVETEKTPDAVAADRGEAGEVGEAGVPVEVGEVESVAEPAPVPSAPVPPAPPQPTLASPARPASSTPTKEVASDTLADFDPFFIPAKGYTGLLEDAMDAAFAARKTSRG